MSIKKTRRKFTPQEKVKIFRFHLLEQKPVSNNHRNLMRTGTMRDKNVYVLNKFSSGPSQENEGRKKTLPGAEGSSLTKIAYVQFTLNHYIRSTHHTILS